ncbi:hypothetical protein Neuguinea42_03890 [Helicobacter pylori]|uniref:hypothetical protein n=1 Tax=Helicobacter pylori TaxID=210 RepID=UPI000A866DDF|nr:hypothetical protein [Helicobacter pylori]
MGTLILQTLDNIIDEVDDIITQEQYFFISNKILSIVNNIYDIRNFTFNEIKQIAEADDRSSFSTLN